MARRLKYKSCIKAGVKTALMVQQPTENSNKGT